MLITDLIEGLKIPFHVISNTTHFVLNVRMMIYGSQKVRLPRCQCMEQKGARGHYGLYLQLFKLTLI